MEIEAANSPEIAILLAIAALAALWTFISKTKLERRGSRLIDWIRQNHREAWAALPWVYRYIFRDRGLAELARRNAISDPDFAREYGKIVPFRRHILISGIIAGGAIAVIVIGVRFFGWQF
jgi:hypothetical protein